MAFDQPDTMIPVPLGREHPRASGAFVVQQRFHARRVQTASRRDWSGNASMTAAVNFARV